MIIFFSVDEVLCQDGDTINTKSLTSLKRIANKFDATLVDVSHWQFYPNAQKTIQKAFKKKNLKYKELQEIVKGIDSTSNDNIRAALKTLKEKDFYVITPFNRYKELKKVFIVRTMNKKVADTIISKIEAEHAA